MRPGKACAPDGHAEGGERYCVDAVGEGVADDLL